MYTHYEYCTLCVNKKEGRYCVYIIKAMKHKKSKFILTDCMYDEVLRISYRATRKGSKKKNKQTRKKKEKEEKCRHSRWGTNKKENRSARSQSVTRGYTHTHTHLHRTIHHTHQRTHAAGLVSLWSVFVFVMMSVMSVSFHLNTPRDHPRHPRPNSSPAALSTPPPQATQQNLYLRLIHRLRCLRSDLLCMVLIFSFLQLLRTPLRGLVPVHSVFGRSGNG